MSRAVSKDLKAFEQTLLETRSIKAAALAAGYSEKTARQGLAKLPKAAIAIVSKRAKPLMAIADSFNAENQEKVVRGGLLGSVLGCYEMTREQTRAAELLGKDKRVNMFTPDVVVGIQVNLGQLQELERDPDIVVTPPDD